MKKLKMKGLLKTETAYEDEGCIVVVDIRQHEDKDDSFSFIVSAREIDEEGNTLLTWHGTVYNIMKANMLRFDPKQVIKDNKAEAVAEALEQIKVRKAAQEAWAEI